MKLEMVQDKIVQLRGQSVMLDYAVADLYGVETREINQAVRNNPKKFPKGYGDNKRTFPGGDNNKATRLILRSADKT